VQGPSSRLGLLQELDHAQLFQVDARAAVAPSQNGVLLCVLLAYPQLVQICTVHGGNPCNAGVIARYRATLHGDVALVP
jgi:hypothetical protein